MATNEQEPENKKVPTEPSAENAQDESTEKKEDGTEEKKEPQGHHRSAAYAESIVHSVVERVQPHHRDLDL